ncbi:DUF427 domain-containing protein [Streptomyces sp. NPDC048564]|uniref:DUF427 domain-containing protein n=1 Tax=Streptomyces sp. NPDC048564 TaxID=3155760 RepID=UPI00344373D5
MRSRQRRRSGAGTWALLQGNPTRRKPRYGWSTNSVGSPLQASLGIDHLEVDGLTNPDAAWYYPRPSPLARKIKDHVAFWQDVRVEGTPEASADGGQ